MNNPPIAAIYRSPAYSPNHIANDAAILRSVCDFMRKRGRSIRFYTESELQAGSVREPVIISMCREQPSLSILQDAEAGGRLVINSAFGVESCKRDRLGAILRSADVSYPPFIVAGTDRAVSAELEHLNAQAFWVKCADFHSRHKEDITLAASPAEAEEVMHEYFMRGIHLAEVSAHISGQLIKFYGINSSDFFHCHCRRPIPTNVDAERLRQMALTAAKALRLDIFGGDVIADPDGSLTIININDWPSFAPCRDAATPHIARAIMARVKNLK